MYKAEFPTPLGTVVLASEGSSLTGLWFLGQKHFPSWLGEAEEAPFLPVFQETESWLHSYFQGKAPDRLPPLSPGGTPFQQRVWEYLLTIPYGQTRTYGEIAKALGVNSAQAVGGAVGRNPISILIPCHRCVGADGSLTGYAGGIHRKQALLFLEKNEK